VKSDLESALAQKFLLSFDGQQPPTGFLELVRRHPIGGVVLFRHLNIETPAQVCELTAALQSAVRQAGQSPLLIAADQEGGQLTAIGEATPFPGNMALGAVASPDLAQRVGAAIGRELAAMGVNVDFAPVVDVNCNPRNPVIGVRSFGEDPALVGRLGAAMIAGLQAAGVAATAKHFPGLGDTDIDAHFGTPVLPFDEARLRRVELPPFAAAVKAGARLVMTAHAALPALHAGADLPATLSPRVLQELLRGELGFTGVIVTDALDMRSVEQGTELTVECLAAARAGADLLMLASHSARFGDIYASLLHAVRRGLLDAGEVLSSAKRILALKEWLAAQERPPFEVIGCREHQDLALEAAAQSLTLVRDRKGWLPLRLAPDQRLLVILPRPADLTPADTSSYVTIGLADELRAYHPQVDETECPMDPTDEDVAALRARAEKYDAILVGTINASAHPGQAAVVRALVGNGSPIIVAALRLPYDLETFPEAPAFVCTYSIQPPSMKALARALVGQAGFPGRLPVTVREA